MTFYKNEISKLRQDYESFYNNQINLGPGFKNYKLVDSYLYKQFLADNGKLYQQNPDKEVASSMTEIIKFLYHNNQNDESILPSPLNFDLNLYNIVKKELNIEIFSEKIFNDKKKEQKSNTEVDLDETLDRYYKRSTYNVKYKKEDVKNQINTITRSTLKNKNSMNIEIEESLDTLLLFNEEEYDLVKNSTKAFRLEEYLRYKSLPENERKQMPMSVKLKGLISTIRTSMSRTDRLLEQSTTATQTQVKNQTSLTDNNEEYDDGMQM